MARKLLTDCCATAQEIMAGAHDADLDEIAWACKARLKKMWRPGVRVKLEGTRNPTYEGAEGVVLKVNQKTVVVGIGDKDQFGYETELNVPPAMLREVA